jgi:hypothetical protein
LWILRTSYKTKDNDSLPMNQSNRTGSIRRTNDHIDYRTIGDQGSIAQESLITKASRLYATVRSRAR